MQCLLLVSNSWVDTQSTAIVIFSDLEHLQRQLEYLTPQFQATARSLTHQDHQGLKLEWKIQLATCPLAGLHRDRVPPAVINHLQVPNKLLYIYLQ
uniref:Uncharacterized protein n=1 Tax=Arundo donax TaxID=35708 RepID=A0A0A9A1M9_ARUDO